MGGIPREGQDLCLRATDYGTDRMSFRERCYRIACRIFRQEIIRDGFRGVLGREPEEEALKAYQGSLPRLGIVGLTKDLATSKEAWEKQKAAHAEELIRQFYQSLLGREPDPQGMESYRSVIGGKGIQEVLAGLIRSAESWHHISGLNPQELLRILYRGILEREADEGGITAKVEKIRKQIPWKEIISEMLQSPEFLTKQGCFLKSGKRDPWDDFLEELSDCRAYHVLRNRKAPEREEIADFIASGQRVRDLKRARLTEELKNPGTMKVLLIGAYGNGNLGDAYQAVAVEQQIRERYRIPEENIFAASHSNVAAFPFNKDRILTREQLMDPDFVNTFGMIMIGGGGILSHPHPPFADKDQWIQSIQIPIIIHAVGAGRKTLNECRTLIRKAVAVSGRDEDSMTALKEFRDDCKLEKDPILMTTALQELERYDETATDEVDETAWDCLWILKYPADKKDREALEVIKGMIGEENRRHLIVAIEPERDRILETWFPSMVNYCTRLTDLNRFIRKSEMLISMRYHGAIFGLLNQKRTLGFSQIKIQSILENQADYLKDFQVTALNL
jgi:hypothetical protein